MATSEHPAQERIVGAVDASAASLLALELAADLAAALRASLAGLFVEEEDLLHAAGLPFVREIRAQSGQAAPFTATDLERHWRALASDARNALTRAAQARRIAWSFEVVRGRASHVMSEAARNARLTGLGSGARAAGRLGSVARAALVATESSLLLVPPQRRPGERWVALVDTPGGAAAVLALASALATTPPAPLLLVAPSLEALGQAALAGTPGAAQLHRMALPELAELPALVAILRAQRAQGLILAADSRFADPAQVERLVADGGWPVLLVR
jgi:nucleotide-binding universal stress UspA family protein